MKKNYLDDLVVGDKVYFFEQEWTVVQLMPNKTYRIALDESKPSHYFMNYKGELTRPWAGYAFKVKFYRQPIIPSKLGPQMFRKLA